MVCHVSDGNDHSWIATKEMVSEMLVHSLRQKHAAAVGHVDADDLVPSTLRKRRLQLGEEP
jgi:hypothetical protein